MCIVDFNSGKIVQVFSYHLFYMIFILTRRVFLSRVFVLMCHCEELSDEAISIAENMTPNTGIAVPCVISGSLTGDWECP